MDKLKLFAENGYVQCFFDEKHDKELLEQEGFFIYSNIINWINPSKGQALQFRNIAISYWKNKLYPLFRQIAIKGNTSFFLETPLHIDIVKEFEDDGLIATYDSKITKLSWNFSTKNFGNELRILSERYEIDKFLPLVKSELSKNPFYLKKMTLNLGQMELLKLESIETEVIGSYVKFKSCDPQAYSLYVVNKQL